MNNCKWKIDLLILWKVYFLCTKYKLSYLHEEQIWIGFKWELMVLVQRMVSYGKQGKSHYLERITVI